MRTALAVALIAAIAVSGCTFMGGCDRGGPPSGNAPYLPFFGLPAEVQAGRLADAFDVPLPPRREHDGVGPVFEDANTSIVIVSASDALGPSASISLKGDRNSNVVARELATAAGLLAGTFIVSGDQFGAAIEGPLPTGERVVFGGAMLGGNIQPSVTGPGPATDIEVRISAHIGPASDLSRATVAVSSTQAQDIATKFVECEAGEVQVMGGSFAFLKVHDESLAWTFMVQREQGAAVVVIDAETGAVLQWTGFVSV